MKGKNVSFETFFLTFHIFYVNMNCLFCIQIVSLRKRHKGVLCEKNSYECIRIGCFGYVRAVHR